MKKILSVLVLVSVVIMITGFVSAAISDEEIGGIGPDNIFYGFDKMSDNIGLAFTFDEDERIQKSLNIAEERMAEANMMGEKGDIDKMEIAQIQYDKMIQKAEDALVKFQARADEDLTEKQLASMSHIQEKIESQRVKILEKKVKLLEKYGEYLTPEQIAEIESLYSEFENTADEFSSNTYGARESMQTQYGKNNGLSGQELDKAMQEIDMDTGLTQGRIVRYQQVNSLEDQETSLNYQNIAKLEQRLEDPNLNSQDAVNIQSLISSKRADMQTSGVQDQYAEKYAAKFGEVQQKCLLKIQELKLRKTLLEEKISRLSDSQQVEANQKLAEIEAIINELEASGCSEEAMRKAQEQINAIKGDVKLFVQGIIAEKKAEKMAEIQAKCLEKVAEYDAKKAEIQAKLSGLSGAEQTEAEQHIAQIDTIVANLKTSGCSEEAIRNSKEQFALIKGDMKIFVQDIIAGKKAEKMTEIQAKCREKLSEFDSKKAEIEAKISELPADEQARARQQLAEFETLVNGLRAGDCSEESLRTFKTQAKEIDRDFEYLKESIKNQKIAEIQATCLEKVAEWESRRDELYQRIAGLPADKQAEAYAKFDRLDEIADKLKASGCSEESIKELRDSENSFRDDLREDEGLYDDLGEEFVAVAKSYSVDSVNSNNFNSEEMELFLEQEATAMQEAIELEGYLTNVEGQFYEFEGFEDYFNSLEGLEGTFEGFDDTFKDFDKHFTKLEGLEDKFDVFDDFESKFVALEGLEDKFVGFEDKFKSLEGLEDKFKGFEGKFGSFQGRIGVDGGPNLGGGTPYSSTGNIQFMQTS